MRPAASAFSSAGGRQGSGSPTQPSGGDGDGEQSVAVAEDRRGEIAERRAELGVHCGHRFAHDVERSARRPAATVDELDGDAAADHLLGDLRSGAVHDTDLVALLAQAEDAARRLGRDGAPDLHDEAAHERYSALMRTYS